MASRWTLVIVVLVAFAVWLWWHEPADDRLPDRKHGDAAELLQGKSGYLWRAFVAAVSVVAVVGLCSELGRVHLQTARASPRRSQHHLPGIIDRIRGHCVDVGRCSMEWNHDDRSQVGGPSVLTVQLKCKNGSPYLFQPFDWFHCSVNHVPTSTSIPHVVEPADLANQSSIKVSFTTRLSGEYCVELKVNDCIIGGRALKRQYLPGPLDPNKTVFVNHNSTVVVTAGRYYTMTMLLKDSFGNLANIESDLLSMEIRKDSLEGNPINPECVVESMQMHFELLMKVEEAGHYLGCLWYSGQKVSPSILTIICVTETQAQELEQNLSKRSLNLYYEAQLSSDRGRTKKVYCYLSSRQLQVYEYPWYYAKVIPMKLFTCKMCPTTRIIIHPKPEILTIDDGFQQPLTISSSQRYKFVLRNIGGSEKFQDKQQFFYNEVKKHIGRHSRSKLKITVKRSSLLGSAMQVTENLSNAEWCEKFEVQFRGEEGLDWGGVSREFFQLLSECCFDSSNGLFRKFKDSAQALVHPNSHYHRSPSLKLKHYEFAGKLVGKCLLESAMWKPLLIKARFTRSFLAQIIGLRVNHKYFESDDPDLYTTKIQFIRYNDVSDLGLVFAEEEYTEANSTSPRVVPLIEGGESTEVTEENKMQYLNLLAQYRLAKCVKEEVDHFIKEMLMCGLHKVSHEDLKKHAVVSGSSHGFSEVMSWFWTITSNFTEEEMAKLLQFVTGCSQLPPGGFKELNPSFTISSAPTHNRLPTAHTCFNQLCLPLYDSCEKFQSALIKALNEGAEGFGLV